ncbi:helix-turn-helix domain-containing protein, partial [Limosilactobacillus mucosae]
IIKNTLQVSDEFSISSVYLEGIIAQGATIQFNVSYQRVYSWVRKYHEAADSWEALKDNRGHRKPQKALEEMTEKERLEAEIKRLKKINREMELEIAFAKKLVEIRNRGVKRPDDIKRFKN